MSRLPRVLVVGSYAAGLVMEMDALPSPGQTVLGRNFRVVHGGKGSNQAVQAARLGASTAFLACLGDDAYGRSCLRLMEENGVDASAVQTRTDLPTGVGFILVDREGRNLISVDMAANGALSPENLRAHARLFVTDAVVAQLEIPLETALEAMRLGSSNGAITVFNPAPACDLTSHRLDGVGFLVPNETEVRVCAGLGPHEPIEAAMERLRGLGCRNIVTTLGEEGCLWMDETGATARVMGFRVDAVDTVGAGDAFTAALAVALCEYPGDVRSAIRFAHAAAALSVTRPDTIPSYHRRDEVERFLRAAGQAD